MNGVKYCDTMFENIKKNIVTLTLLFVTIFRFWKSYPLSNLVPLFSSDFSSHIFKIQYIIDYGITGWNYFWYGGFPFLKYYPPISYIITASIGKITGAIIAFNLTSNIAWILTPIVFYLILREYKLSNKQVVFSLIFFSFIPSNIIFFNNGNMPLNLSFLFALLFWRSIKRVFDKNENIILSIIFLTFSLLTHVLIGATLVLFVIIWFLTAYFNKNNLTKLLTIFLLSGIISSFWYIPFISSSFFGRYGSVSLIENPVEYMIHTSIQRLEGMKIPPILFVIILPLSLIAFLFSIKNWRDKHFKEFFPVLLISTILFIILDYKRTVLFMSIFLPFILFLNLKRKNIYFIHIPLLIFIIISFSFFNIEFIESPEIPKTGNRVMYYTNICDNCAMHNVFYPIMNDEENINGWFHTVEETKELEGSRSIFLKKLKNSSISYDEYQDLANAGMINFVVVERGTDFFEYFNSNPYFKEGVENPENIIVYEADPKFSYLDLNGEGIDHKLQKNVDEINLEFDCNKGILTIKETFDNSWKVFLDDEEIKINVNKYGFIETKLEKEGNCKIILKYNKYNQFIP